MYSDTRKAYEQRRRKENPQKFREYRQTARRNLWDRLCEMYGTSCAWCGITDRRVLTLDHIHGGGTKARGENSPDSVYRLALQENNLKKYRILCCNCQRLAYLELKETKQMNSNLAKAIDILIKEGN